MVGDSQHASKLDPTAAPSYDVPEVPWQTKLRVLVTDVLPMVAIMAFLVAMLLMGWATPSESAAFGALSVIVLGAVYRCLSWQAWKLSVEGALKVTLMAFLIVFGSATFSQLLAIFAVLLILGTFMEQISIMMLTVPFFFPLAQSLGFDLIWFGIVVLLALEISFSTPPLGLLLFVMKGVAPAGTTMREIYLAAIPYILCSMLLVAMLIVFPPLATWLPSYLG